jgi:cobalt-zinc-cadmium efflux system outer membrane protein
VDTRFPFALACCAALVASIVRVASADGPDVATVTPIRFAQIPAEPIPLPPVDGQANAALMTLAEAELLAMGAHPALREAGGMVRSAQGQWLQSGLRPNPTIGYQGEEIGDEGHAGMQGGYFSQEFVTAGKLGLSRAVALREVAATEQRLERTRLQVLTTVRMYYYESLAAERALALAKQLEQVGSQALEASELRLKALEGTKAAMLQSQVEYNSAQLLAEQATNRRDAARRRLASVVGSQESITAPLDDTLGSKLPTLDWESARVRLLAESPELAQLRFEVDAARWAVQRQVAGRVPNVTVMSGAQYDYATEFAMANVQVSMPIPVFNRNQGNIATASGQLVAAQSALEARELSLTQQLATAMGDYLTASRRVARYTSSILPAARQSLDLVSTAYEQGELEYLDILNTQRTYTEKNIGYLNDLESAWKKWAEIDGLLVGPLATTSQN